MDWFIYLAVAVFLVALLYLVWSWKGRKKWSENDRRFYINSWKKIMETSEHRLQLMEADKLLDHMMGRRGYSGSLGEKLKRNSALFTDLNALWAAHKLRNRLAHEMNAKITAQEVARALRAFKNAFDDLGLNVKR